MSRAAMQQALEALEYCIREAGPCEHECGVCVCMESRAAEALRAELAKPEPVLDQNQAFIDYAAKFDTFGNQWQDMGADEYFCAGWSEALKAANWQPLPQPPV